MSLRNVWKEIAACSALTFIIGTCTGIKIADSNYNAVIEKRKKEYQRYPENQIISKDTSVVNGNTIINIKTTSVRTIPDSLLMNFRKFISK